MLSVPLTYWKHLIAIRNSPTDWGVCASPAFPPVPEERDRDDFQTATGHSFFPPKIKMVEEMTG